jgi:hypothetical protein
MAASSSIVGTFYIASLADASVGASAEYDPRRRAGVRRFLDDDSAVDDDGRARAAWIAMWVCVSRLVPKIIRIKDRDVSTVAFLQQPVVA